MKSFKESYKDKNSITVGFIVRIQGPASSVQRHSFVPRPVLSSSFVKLDDHDQTSRQAYPFCLFPYQPLFSITTLVQKDLKERTILDRIEY